MNGRIFSRQSLGTAAVFSAMALVVLDAGMLHVALPTIAGAFGETPARSMQAVTAYQLALLVGLLPSAQVANRFGYRRLFAGGLILFGCAALLSAASPTLLWLTAARALQGVGAAAILSLGIALLRAALGVDRLPAAIAWNALVVAICSGLAPAAGALLLSLANWRWLFAAALPIAWLAVATARALPAVRSTRSTVDLAAIALYVSGIGGVVIAAELAPSVPSLAAGVALAGLAAAYMLYGRERGSKAPLVPLDLLALRPLRRSVLASILLFTGQTAALLALPFHLQLSLDRSIATAGMVIAVWPLAVAATSGVANRLANRFACEVICAVGGIVLAAGLAALALSPADGGIMPVAACAFVCGVGFGLFQVPNNRTMFLSAPDERSAAAGGLQGTARLAGQTAGALLLTFVLSAAPLASAPRLAIGLAAVLAVAAAMVSWRSKALAT